MGSTVKKNDIYVTSLVEQGGNGGGGGVRVITCDAHINVVWTSSGYRGSFDAVSASALYEEIFGRPYAESSDATYEDIANLPAIPIFIKFTNFTMDSGIASSSLFFLFASASPNEQADTISVQAVAGDVTIDIVSL